MARELIVSPDDKCALQIIKLAVGQAERIKSLEADNAALKALLAAAQNKETAPA